MLHAICGIEMPFAGASFLPSSNDASASESPGKEFDALPACSGIIHLPVAELKQIC